MLKDWSQRRLIVVFVGLTILSGVLFLPVVYSLSDHFSRTERVDANILLVEGWLSPYGLNMAFDEFNLNGYDHIVTTGLKSTPDYFNVFTKKYN